MKRHRFDAVSFVFGTIFLVISGALTARNYDLFGPGLKWVAAGSLLVIGIGLMLGSRIWSDDR